MTYMLQKYRHLWKIISILALIVTHGLLLAINIVHGMETDPLNISLFAIYMILICIVAFLCGQKRTFLFFSSLYWGVTCLSYVIVAWNHSGWLSSIMLLILYHTMSPFFSVHTLLKKCIGESLSAALIFVSVYLMILAFHYLGKRIKSQKEL